MISKTKTCPISVPFTFHKYVHTRHNFSATPNPQFTHLGAERPLSARSVHCGTPLCPPESSGCLSGSTGTSCEERHHETQTHQAAFMTETTVIMKPLICGFALCACPTTPVARPAVSDLRPGHRTWLFNSIRHLIETTDLGLLH